MDWYLLFDKQRGKYESNLDLLSTNLEKPVIYIDGYILPRQSCFKELKSLNQIQLIEFLFDKYGNQFINYIKGIFIIIISYRGEVSIYTDRHGIKKAFISEENNIVKVSGNLHFLKGDKLYEIDPDKAALFALLSHNLPGQTFFKNIATTLPAGKLLLSSEGFINSVYWHPKELLHKKNVIKKSISYYAEEWKLLLDSYLEYFKPYSIFATLTGGNDSRMVLSALLALKKTLNTFTYGNPLSFDAIIANKIAKEVNLNHKNHFVTHLSSQWLNDTSQEILEYGNSLINIHRAHRHDAVNEASKASENKNMLFTGLVGGEYLKETYFNDVAIPKIFSNLFELSNKSAKERLLVNELKNRGVKVNRINIEEIHRSISTFLANGDNCSLKEKKFIYTFLFYGCAHHTQDSVVFSKHYKYVVNPYLDIDFLEMMAGSIYWHLNKKEFFYSKFFHSKFLVSITHQLAPELSLIPYAKKGSYTAEELVNHPFYYFLKRLKYFIIKDTNQHPANFPMGDWLLDFVKQHLNKMPVELQNVFDKDCLENQLQQLKNKKSEKTWHIVTNPINIQLNYEYFSKA